MNRREFSQQLCGAALSAAFAKMTVAQQENTLSSTDRTNTRTTLGGRRISKFT
jgi:hypothetical protein